MKFFFLLLTKKIRFTGLFFYRSPPYVGGNCMILWLGAKFGR